MAAKSSKKTVKKAPKKKVVPMPKPTAAEKKMVALPKAVKVTTKWNKISMWNAIDALNNARTLSSCALTLQKKVPQSKLSWSERYYVSADRVKQADKILGNLINDLRVNLEAFNG